MSLQTELLATEPTEATREFIFFLIDDIWSAIKLTKLMEKKRPRIEEMPIFLQSKFQSEISFFQ